MILEKEWVSATKIKNYLMKDPIIDWLDLYYFDKIVKNSCKNVPPHIHMAKKRQKEEELKSEKSKLHILFEMGNKFEDEVVKYLRIKFNGKMKSVVENPGDICEDRFNDTIKYMKKGVPIIDQAVLYNYSNMTYGVADLIVRSDYLNQLVDSPVLTKELEKLKAPNLNGNYHYRVIDIKWTTMLLCSNGVTIRNSARFPAYKGQLAIYNAAIGVVQGYTPNEAYILSKSWKYETCGDKYDGYNCFDLLGVVEYDGFDETYVEMTKKAIKWIRDVRYNGHKWKVDFKPTVEELYPNMNNHYDTPWHMVKKDIASRNKELTEIFYIGVKHRKNAHKKGIFKWSDPRCTAKAIGMYGKKLGPIIDEVLKINRDRTGKRIEPQYIRNDDYEWQTKKDIEFYVDFETINGAFYNQEIRLENSREINGVIFLIGVGYEENGVWTYKSFSMSTYTLAEERRVIQEFVDFIENRVIAHMRKYRIRSRNLVFPSLFHWGHAERTMFRTADNRHGNIWSRWKNEIYWVDYCNIMKKEPIVVKGAKKFGLKEIAKAMKYHNFIQSSWDDAGPQDGLNALIQAAEYYRFMNDYNNLNQEEQIANHEFYSKHIHNFSNIIKYNEMDCKTMWEIVEYFRNNHCYSSS